MNALLSARFRRQWPLAGSMAVLAVFLLVNSLVFQPLAARYRRALSQAGAMGAILDPRGIRTPSLPPRVFALLMDNSLGADEVNRKGASGALGAELVQSLSGLAAKRGLEVVVAEPGLLTEQPGSVEARVHLRVHGSYAGFVRFLDDVTRGGKLAMVERFTISPAPNSSLCDIEIYMSSCLLKRSGGRP